MDKTEQVVTALRDVFCAAAEQDAQRLVTRCAAVATLAMWSHHIDRTSHYVDLARHVLPCSVYVAHQNAPGVTRVGRGGTRQYLAKEQTRSKIVARQNVFLALECARWQHLFPDYHSLRPPTF